MQSRRLEIPRRGFLRSTVPAALAGSTAWTAPANGDSDTAAQQGEGPSATSEIGPVPTFRGICEQHLELVVKRSEQRRRQIVHSLRRQDARPVTVAACQMRNHSDGERGKKSNLGRMLAAIQGASRDGVGMLAFPELCLPGYFTSAQGTPAEAVANYHALCDEADKSEYLAKLQDAAGKAKMVLAFGFCEKSGDAYYNAIGVIDADGSWVGTRRKNPLSPHPYETEPFTEPSWADRSAVFKTLRGTVGVLNCFDGEFPESVRRMRLDGAEILLWCNAATGNVEFSTSNRINYAGTYAQANRMWVVVCNAVGGKFYGTSVIAGPSGEPLVILPSDREALAVATFNLALSEDWDRWRSRLGPPWPRQTP